MDDDVDVLLNEQIKEDLNAAEDEDAPQIVSVIDERPPSLRIDEVSKNKLWLPIGETVDISAASVGVKFEGNIKLEGNKSQSNKLATKHLKKEKKHSESDGGDILHPSEIKKEKDEDISPPRKRTNHLSDSPSPPRRIKKEQSEDISPPRKSKRSSPLRDKDSNIKREKSADISPPRKSNRRSPTPDISPPRRKRSAPNSPVGTRRKSSRNGDITPPHKSNKRNSPLRDKDRKKQSRNEDSSPPRRPKQTPQSDHNRSPPRHRDKSGRKKSRWAEDEDQTEKLKKTLDGKTAGLQNATDLVAETSQLKQKEDELFRNMSAEISGANAATVVRKKKKDVDWEEEERKRKKEAENKEKYDRWGKGLKQVGDASEKFQNELYEMSKPLAR